MSDDLPITAAQARKLLGLDVLASPAELRRAFREAAKRAHPDRVGGDTSQFREVVAAFHRLNRPLPERIIQPPATRTATPDILTISPAIALQGGAVRHRLPDGRVLSIRLPAGLRSGDAVRAGGVILSVALRSDPAMLVRGDDLWITAPVAPAVLAAGGRISVETPLGRRILWVDAKAAARGLLRLPGQGLPARGRHARGCLFIRLRAGEAAADSAARTLLRRFTAAWAA